MRSSTWFLGPILGSVLITLVAMTPASAAHDENVSTDPTGAHVLLTRGGAWIEAGPPPGGAPGSGTATGCRRRWVPNPGAVFLRPGVVDPDFRVVHMPAPPTPEHVAYFVYCDGRYVTSVWLLPTQFTGAVVDPREIAERLARDLPYPPATVGASPAARGLTGLESWFWVDGYSAAPIHDEVDGLGLRVEVEATPDGATWDFGDGTARTAGSLGLHAPTRSDVTHRFERPSRRGPITVHANVRLAVRWRSNGGSWQLLDPVERSASLTYPVAESRAALVPSAGR